MGVKPVPGSLKVVPCGPLEGVTFTVAAAWFTSNEAVPRFPTPSVASIVIVCTPLARLTVQLHAVVHAPEAPLRLHLTLATPLGSLAVPETVNDVLEVDQAPPLVGVVIETVGPAVSGAVTVSETVLLLRRS